MALSLNEIIIFVSVVNKRTLEIIFYFKYRQFNIIDFDLDDLSDEVNLERFVVISYTCITYETETMVIRAQIYSWKMFSQIDLCS